jgi:type II secretory pathway pseudopilin PulG
MQHRQAAPRRGSAAGVTLAEALVAVAITSILVVGLLTVLQSMTLTHERGEKAALSQQEVRNAFDTLVKELRFVGFDYDRDGLETPYPGQPDEQVEFAGAAAITIRGNFDFEDENGGRELDLETPESDPDFEEVCCPIVTTGNDEIVTFALRSEDASKNLDEVVLRVDVQPATGRDAIVGVDGPENEETVTIERVDFSNENPPYELIRFTIDPTGTRVEERVLARNVRSLGFTYEDSAGNPYFCKSGAPPCTGSDRVLFDTVGGGDDVVANDGLGREARAAIRSIGVSLVGMEEKPDLRYVDPDADLSNPAEAAVAKYRKYELDASVTPPNLGSRGRRDTDSVAPEVVTNVTACVGQCAAVRVEWNEAKRASSYLVQLYDPTTTPPTMIFSGNAGAQEIPNTTPQRLYAAFDSHNDVQIQDGVTVYAVVTAQNSAGSSEPSIASASVTLVDLVRPEAPLRLNASGYEDQHPDWPDVAGAGLSPVSDPTDDDYPREGVIAVRWSPPRYALDIRDPKNPDTSWDTRVSTSTLPALACDAVPGADLDGNGSLEHERTPLRELSWGQRYLIFRSTDPRFVPTADDLVAITNGQRNSVTGQLEFIDRPQHEYDGMGNFVRTVNDLSCCTTYYYRMRAVDACWSGADPASTSDPHLSPFTPPLNTGDVPDSDDVSTLASSEVGLAVPGYAIPAAAAAAPADLRYSEFDATAKTFRWSFRAPKVDTAPAPGPNQAVYREYVLWSHATNPDNRLDAFANGQNGGKVEARITVGDTGALDVDGGYVTVGDAATRYYRVAAVQCLDDDVANEAGDPYALDVGEGSTAVKIPCNFGGGPLTFVDVDSSSFPTAVVATMVPEDPAVTLARGRLILSDPVSGHSVSTPAPGLEPAVAGGYSVIFGATEIAALLEQMPAGVDLDIRVDFKDSQGCFVQSDPQTLALQPPDCCFEQELTLVSVDSADGFTWSIPITTICGAEVAITSMDLLLGSAKFEQLWWEGVPIWTGSDANAVLDLSLTPLIVPAGTTPVLRAQTSKAIQGDQITLDLTHEMLGNSGSCNFSEYDIGQAPLDCCLSAPSAPLWYDAGTDWIGEITLTEVCGTSLELSYLDLWQNAGKYEQVEVDGTAVWSGSTPTAYADLSASPPSIAPGGTTTIRVHSSKSWSGNSMTLDVGFGAGHCVFSQVNIP